MDYHQFKTYEKITNAAGFPRTRQEQGLFLLELDFSPEQETRAINVPMTLEFTGFGDVSRLTIAGCSTYTSPEAIQPLRSKLAPSDPPICLEYDAAADSLTFQFLENPAQRTRRIVGSLVFNPKGELTTLVARLHS